MPARAGREGRRVSSRRPAHSMHRSPARRSPARRSPGRSEPSSRLKAVAGRVRPAHARELLDRGAVLHRVRGLRHIEDDVGKGTDSQTAALTARRSAEYRI